MQYLSINLGSFSLKYSFCIQEGKKLKIGKVGEIEIGPVLSGDGPEEGTSLDEFSWQRFCKLSERQFDLIESLISDFNFKGPVVINAPNDLIMTRFFTIPVKNRKKAQMMIPFQLEEEIPQNLSEIHLASSLETIDEKTEAQVNIVPEREFAFLYELIEKRDLPIRYITSEAGTFDHYIRHTLQKFPQNFCLLDLGHRSTKAYVFRNSKLTSVHKSYVAGEQITYRISSHYKISFEEAQLYKHENAFLIGAQHKSGLNEKQIEFANLMDEVLNPLSLDFKRWEVSHRVSTGEKISQVYILGGSADIKNTSAYLQEKLKLPVAPIQEFDSEIHELASEQITSGQLTALIQSICLKTRTNLNFLNFLQGKFSLRNFEDLPLIGYFFTGARLAILVLFLCLGLGAERYFLAQDSAAVTKKLSDLSKNTQLNLNGRLQRNLLTKTDQEIPKLEKNLKELKRKIDTVKEASNFNPLVGLNILAQSVNTQKTDVRSYQADSPERFNAVIKVAQMSDLQSVSDQLEKSGLANIKVTKLTNDEIEVLGEIR